MKLPRDMTGVQLSKGLAHFGYAVTRQAGSHMRLTTQQRGEHHITIPAHKPVRVGTLNAIITDVADHMGISKDDVISAIL